MYYKIKEKLAVSQKIILDGGIGSEIQYRGVPMDGDVWCAMANITHPEIVKNVYSDYIDAGADIITANTYATSPLLFEALGRMNEIAEIDQRAIQLLREARNEAESRPLAIAGSFSIMRPIETGSDHNAAVDIPTARLKDILKQKAEILASSGVDLIIMEMMRDLDYSLMATEAAVATGLPVWLGIAVERREDGYLAGFDDRRCTLDDLVSVLMETGPEACLVMHNDINTTPDALQVIKQHWAGPIGAYPESGIFKMPNWEFGDISAEDFAIHARRWSGLGATIIGGCCGIRPEHIAALSKEFKTGQAAS